MVPADQTLPGRSEAVAVPPRHAVLDHPMTPPFPEGFRTIQVGMGCFWGAERVFWRLPGVWTTAVGYSGGDTPNPTYSEVCSGGTNHAETVLVVYDPAELSDAEMLAAFWEGHDPTQAMRQGNDIGTQYRSALYWYGDDQRRVAEATRAAFGQRLTAAGRGEIVTEVRAAPTFYYAEDYHQQYLHKVPDGYCGLGGTGVTCPTGIELAD
jgi:peptide-methionine (S)-S-oxide reductase